MGGGLEHAITRRIVVALELTPLGPESALSVVVAFCQMFRAGEPVELAIHAYTEPTLDLLQRVRRVVHTMVGEVDGVAPIVLYAQGELGDLPYDDAFAAIGDPLDDALSVARVVHLMHAMRADLDAQSGQRLSLHVAEPMSRSTLLERVTRRPRRSGIQLTPAEPRNPFPEGHFYAPTVDANELASRAAEIWVAPPGHRGDRLRSRRSPRHLEGDVPSPSPQVRLPRGAA